jgi:hypothetical protein
MVYDGWACVERSLATRSFKTRLVSDWYGKGKEGAVIELAKRVSEVVGVAVDDTDDGVDGDDADDDNGDVAPPGSVPPPPPPPPPRRRRLDVRDVPVDKERFVVGAADPLAFWDDAGPRGHHGAVRCGDALRAHALLVFASSTDEDSDLKSLMIANRFDDDILDHDYEPHGTEYLVCGTNELLLRDLSVIHGLGKGPVRARAHCVAASV